MNEIYGEGEYLYLQENNKLIVFDKELNQKTVINIKNIAIFKDLVLNIDDDIVKIYKNIKLYYSYQLPKAIKNFIINDSYIFSFDKNILTVFSIIGNKIVFNSTISKNNIINLIYKNDLLFVLTLKDIIVLDLISKKIKLKIPVEAKLFDTDGKYIIVAKNNILYKINFDKDIIEYNLDINNITKIKIKENYFFIQENTNLYLFDTKNLYLVSKVCKAFEVKNGIIYVLESIIQKYSINKVLKKDIIKILTVDDSATMRLIIKNAILNNFKNVSIYEAKNGKIALDVLEKNPDMNILFLDWNMPILNGKDTVVKIRQNHQYDNLKIIIATTENDKNKIKEMISYGVKGYLIKPLKPTSVVPVTKKMIELIKQERENV